MIFPFPLSALDGINLTRESGEQYSFVLIRIVFYLHIAYIIREAVIMKTGRVLFLVIFILLLTEGTSQVLAQDLQVSLTVGDVVKVQSKVMDEERILVIGKPVGYDQSNQRYPVIYVLDGEDQYYHAVSTIRFLGNHGRMPKALVVGIANTHRTLDFTMHQLKDGRESGGGEKFFEFMEKELFPFIEKNFRTQPFRILFGHSLTGMYALHCLFTKPDLIHAIIAASPWIVDEHKFVFDEARDYLKKESERNHFYFLTVGAEPEILDPVKRISKLLKRKGSEKLIGDFEFMPKDDHGSVPLKSIYNGLEMMFKGWQITRKELTAGKAIFEKHYQSLSDHYGYPIAIPEDTVNTAGYLLMQEGKLKSAIEMFRFNIELYPHSSNVYDSLGECLEQNGQFEESLKYYEIAIKKGKEDNSPFLDLFEEHRERVNKKLKD